MRIDNFAFNHLMNLERNSNIFGNNSDPVSSVIKPSQALTNSKPNFGIGEIKSTGKDQNKKNMFDFKIKPITENNKSKVHEINPTHEFQTKQKQNNEAKNKKVEKINETSQVPITQDLLFLGGDDQNKPQVQSQSQIETNKQGVDLFDDIFGNMSHSVNIPNQGNMSTNVQNSNNNYNNPMGGYTNNDPQENKINSIMNQLYQKENKQADSYDFTFKHKEQSINNQNYYNNNQQNYNQYPSNNQYYNQQNQYGQNLQHQQNYNYYTPQQTNNHFIQSEPLPNQSSLVNYEIDRSMGGYGPMNQSNMNQVYNNMSVSEIQHNTNNNLDFFDTIKDNSHVQNQMIDNRNQNPNQNRGNHIVDDFFN